MRTREIFSTREEKFRKFKQLKCSMGRKECHKTKKKGDAYKVGKHSRLTPHLSHVIFYLLFDY